MASAFANPEQAGQRRCPAGIRSLAEGNVPTTKNPSSGVKNKENRYHRVALWPFLSANSETNTQRNIQTMASPIAMRSEVMASPRGRAPSAGADLLILWAAAA